MTFGQVVVGPPGSGKTTYCNAASQLLAALGRKVAIVNLDPANDIPPYTPSVDVAELVSLENVMRELQLGPNGGAQLTRHAAGRGARVGGCVPPRPQAHLLFFKRYPICACHSMSGEAAGSIWSQTPWPAPRPAASGMLYCMEYLAANLDWLKERLDPLQQSAVGAGGRWHGCACCR